MEPTRAAIAAIQNNLKGNLYSLVEREETLETEGAQQEFNNLTNNAVWEAVYTLADHIDALRR